MSTEQSYDELYDKGFDEKDTAIEVLEEETPVEEEEIEEESLEEEESEETLEQPTDEEDAPEETDGEPDEDTEEDATEEEPSDSTEEPETYSITIGGQEVNLTLDEMKLFAQKGGDYTRKTQDLAKSRAEIEFMKEHGLSHEDLVTLKDIKTGNKEAFAAIAKQAGIDPLDVQEDTSYKPEVAQRNFELEDVVSEIRNDTTNGSVIDGWISALPQNVKDSMAETPAILKGLHVDTVNGIGKEIMPEVIKQLAINPNADFVSLYQSVGNEIVSRQEPKEEEKPSKPEAKRETKKRAAVSKKKTQSSHLKDHQDVWDDDELFESMKKQLEDLK